MWRHLFSVFTWRLAWRDSRRQRPRLLLYTVCITLGVAAISAITSFRANVKDAIDAQAKTLLGADLRIRSRGPFPEKVEPILDKIPGERSRVTSFRTMANFPKQKGTRLVSVRAVTGGWPWYGELETEPAAAVENWQDGPAALVDDTLMLMFGVEVGDEIRLGYASFTIAGRLLRVPGESVSESNFAPRVYIPGGYVDNTGLVRKGSRVRYHEYYKLPAGIDPEAKAERLEYLEDEYALRLTTVASRRERTGRALSNMYQFLNLAGLAALLLGGIGVGSSVSVHIRQKLPSVAILRCLGASGGQTQAVYVVQTLMMGAIGAFAGVLIGVAVQFLLPGMLSRYVPVAFTPRLSWTALLGGSAAGVTFALLFALWPLAGIRRVSPLAALRADFNGLDGEHRGLGRWLVWAAIALLTSILAVAQSAELGLGFGTAGALLATFVLLTGLAHLLMFVVRRLFPQWLPYVWRQALRNLYRPHNQTVPLILCLGLGTFLILTMHLSRDLLLAQLERSREGNNPSMVLFNIQSDQLPGVRKLLNEEGLPLLDEVPIVNMRLSKVKGRPVAELRADPDRDGGRWALSREYHSTYRGHLNEGSETVIAGEWISRTTADGPVPISLHDRIAEELDVWVGDRLEFDVQGVPVETIVASIREIDWYRIEPNFFVVFPTGVLEDAPQMHVIVTRVPNREVSAHFQRIVVERFPNVSLIDLSLVLDTLTGIMDKVGFVLRFMSMFSIATGLIVLVASLTTSRYQRLQESVLLRTIGASKRQIICIMLGEFALLGSIGALAGVALAVAGTWGLSFFVFQTGFKVEWQPLVIAWASVTGLTLLIGGLNSIGVWNQPPLDILRKNA